MHDGDAIIGPTTDH